MRILRWSGRHNLLVHLLPRGNVSTHHSPHSTPRREWQLTHTHIAPVRHLHVLAIIARHAPLHVDQVPLGVDLVHLLLTHAPRRHQQVLHRAVLVAHLTRHLLPLERLARVLRLTRAAHAHLALAVEPSERCDTLTPCEAPRPAKPQRRMTPWKPLPCE